MTITHWFPWGLYLGGAALAGVVSFAALGRLIPWCHRTALIDQPGHRKIHENPIPLAGGLAVLLGILAPLIGGSIAAKLVGWPGLADSALEYGLDRRLGQLLAIAIGAVAITLLGVWDDRHALRPGVKFLGQVGVVLLVALAGVRITLFVPNLLFSYIITLIWFLTLINAFNFMDNMNGLCAGLGALAAVFFALSAAIQGHYLVALLGFVITGSLIGFLPHNFPRARSFLGDAGSHLTGYLAALLAVLPHFYEGPGTEQSRWAVLKPVIILAVPLLDLVCVVWIRWRLGQPFYVGDNNHLSHRLVRRGLSKTDSVLLIWFLAACCGAASFLLS